MTTTLHDEIKDLIQKHKILVFMKGEKLMPMCSFSNTVVEILNSLNVHYHTINVLTNNKLREDIKTYSQWPTIPQVYINTEFIGGADIMLELYRTKKLQEILERAINT